MKILYVNDYAPPCAGAELIVDHLAKGIRSRGHETRLLSSCARLVGTEGTSDFSCYGTTSVWQPVIEAGNLSAARSIKRALDEFEPDVVHLNMYLWQISPSIMPHLDRVPTVYYAMTYKSICPKGTKLLPDRTLCDHSAGTICFRSGCVTLRSGPFRLLQQHRFGRRRTHLDRIVAVSQWLRERLQRDGVEVDDVILPGIASGSGREPHLARNPRIGFAGRLSPEKGVDVLIEALGKVIRAVPDLELVIAGTGPSHDSVADLVARHGLAGRTTMAGHLEPAALDHALGTIWVQVVPSVWEEPFGLVAIEAMHRGTAVVASAIGGLTESVVHGRTGVLVSPNDPDELAAALTPLLLSRDRAAELGERGRSYARATFSIESFIDRFEALYTEMRR